MQDVPPDVWIERCAHRIVEMDGDIDADEARLIAREMHAFERTTVMTPERAAEFVAEELVREERTPFERRTTPRH